MLIGDDADEQPARQTQHTSVQADSEQRAMRFMVKTLGFRERRQKPQGAFIPPDREDSIR
jgi:hypothetical protein